MIKVWLPDYSVSKNTSYIYKRSFYIQLKGCDIMGDCYIHLEKLETESIMALTQLRKQEIISNYQVHETDTGSADVQVAMLTERINRLSEHLQANKKDHSSRRGLLKLIGQRKRLLAYISQESREKYQALIARLGIRG